MVEEHGYNIDCIDIKGTETLVERGGTLEVEVIIPKPPMSVFEAIDMGSCERPSSYEPYAVGHSIQSEYMP